MLEIKLSVKVLPACLVISIILTCMPSELHASTLHGGKKPKLQERFKAETEGARQKTNFLGRVLVFEAALVGSDSSSLSQGSSTTPGSLASRGSADVVRKHAVEEVSVLRSPEYVKSEVALTDVLLGAEIEYQKNLRRRSEAFQGQKPLEMSRGDLEAAMLAPLYPCPLQSRLGSWLEQGRWVCLSQYPSSNGDNPVAVSVGPAAATSFEDDLYSSLGIVAHSFGPSSRTGQLSYPLHLHPEVLTHSLQVQHLRRNAPQVRWITIYGILRKLRTGFVDVFKVDCGGCEYGVVQDLVANYTRASAPFGQILMEVHNMTGASVGRATELLAGLESLGYRLFHARPNPYARERYAISVVHERLVKPRLS